VTRAWREDLAAVIGGEEREAQHHAVRDERDAGVIAGLSQRSEAAVTRRGAHRGAARRALGAGRTESGLGHDGLHG